MDIDGSFSRGWFEEPFQPAIGLVSPSRRQMIPGNVANPLIAGKLEGAFKRGNSLPRCYLNIDDVLCSQSWYGGRTDMVNTKGETAQILA